MAAKISHTATLTRMCTRFALTLVVTLFSTGSFAQVPSFIWARQGVSSGQPDQAFGTAIDSSGNIYVTGSLNFEDIYLGKPSFIHIPSSGRFFLSKYDSNGNELWTRLANEADLSVGADCTVDSDGNVVVVGGFASTNLGLDGIVVTNAGLVNVFVAKYSKGGDLLWLKQGGGSSVDAGLSVRVDSDGNSVIAGRLASTNAWFGTCNLSSSATNFSHQAAFLAAYDSNGTAIWAQEIQGAFSSVIALDTFGRIAVTGTFIGQADFGNGTVVTNSSTDGTPHGFLATFDTGGNVIWAYQAASGPGKVYVDAGITNHIADIETSIAVDRTGNFYLTGSYDSSNVVFGSTTLSNRLPPLDAVFIAKFDSNGIPLWAKGDTAGAESLANSIAVDAAGNSYTTGWYDVSAKFGDITLPQSLDDQAFVLKCSSTGDVLWAKTTSAPDLGWAHVNAITGDQWGNLLLSGDFNSSAGTFDGIVLISTNILSAVFIAKISGPTLGIQPSGNNVVISWPTNAAGLNLESATALSGPWSPVTNSPVANGEQFVVTNAVAGGSRYYRLRNF